MTPILLPREEYLKQTVFHLVESRSGIARRQRSSNLVRRFASTISYSGATPPSRSGLRSEPRPSGSGLSIRHCNSEYVRLVNPLPFSAFTGGTQFTVFRDRTQRRVRRIYESKHTVLERIVVERHDGRAGACGARVPAGGGGFLRQQGRDIGPQPAGPFRCEVRAVQRHRQQKFGIADNQGSSRR